MVTPITLFWLFDLFRIFFSVITLIGVSLLFVNCEKDEEPQPLALLSFFPSRGSAGSTVTLEGTGFSTHADKNVVLFNSIPATVTTATSTQLTVTVPEGATDGFISVTINNVTYSLENFIVTDRWQQKADVGGRRDNGFCFTVNGKGYIGSGSGARVDFWEYDPGSDTWTQKQNFEGASRIYSSGFGIGSKGYVTGGIGPDVDNEVWQYDPSGNNWTRKNDFGGGSRFAAVSFTIGSKGYVGTGGITSSATVLKDLWEYDPSTDSWTRKADLPGTPIVFGFGFAIGLNGYIGGGVTRPGEVPQYSMYEYNPALDRWNQKADLPSGANFAFLSSSFSSSTKGYANERGNTHLWQFDPAANSWSRKADIPSSAWGIGFTIGDYGYMGESYDKMFYRYTLD